MQFFMRIFRRRKARVKKYAGGKEMVNFRCNKKGAIERLFDGPVGVPTTYTPSSVLHACPRSWIISLAPTSRSGSSDLPEATDRTHPAPDDMGAPLFGLAPGGVYPSPPYDGEA